MVSTLRQLLDSTKVRFLLIGAWNTAFGYAVFWVLYGLFARVFSVRYLAYTSAQIVGWIIAVANAYGLHRKVTFRSRTTGRAAVMEFLRFMQTYVAMFLVGLVLLPFLVEIVGFGPRVAALVATAIGVVLSYFGHRFITFRTHGSPQA
jgi:putative flippase GtrA